MGWTSRIASLFGRPSAAGEVSLADPSRLVRYLPMPDFIEGLYITPDTALQLSVVWACVDAINKAIASCPWNILTRDGRRLTLLPDDPLGYLLNVRPNPEMTAIAFREALGYGALTWGNGYAEIVRATSGRIAELWPLLPDRVTMRRHPETDEIYYEVMEMDGGRKQLPPSRIFHVRGPSLTGFLGEGIVSWAARSIGLGLAAERYGSAYYGNNATVGAVLEYPKTLTQEAYDRLKADWEEKRQGVGKAHKPLILEGGMKFTPIGNEPEKAQLVESRKFQVEEICRWFGVPPHKVQHLERSTFNNIEHLGIEFVRDSLTPWALRFQQEADFKLFPARAPWRQSKIDMAWLTQGDARSRWEAYQIGRRIGALSANDILEMEGMNGIGPEGDIRIVESNMQSLDALKAAEANAKLKGLPEVYQYHLAAGIPTKNEVRARLGLPPVEGGDEFTSIVDLNAPPPPAGGAPAEGVEPPEEPAQPDDPGAPVEPEEPDEDDDQEEPAAAAAAAPRAVLAEAMVVLFAGSLERYGRRLAAREADLVRAGHRASKVEGNLADERERLRPRLLDECREGIALLVRVESANGAGEDDVIRAADEVDNGVPPRVAAERLVAQLLTPAGPAGEGA